MGFVPPIYSSSAIPKYYYTVSLHQRITCPSCFHLVSHLEGSRFQCSGRNKEFDIDFKEVVENPKPTRRLEI